MKLVVTGAAGFVGSQLVDRLLEDGHTVAGIDAFVPYYPREVKERNLSDARMSSAFTFHDLDLRADDLRPVVAGADAVLHLAAMPGLPRSWAQFDLYMTCNLQATQRLLEAMQGERVHRLVYASTSSVYGAHATGDEHTALHPVSPYGVTKLAAEQLCLAYHVNFGLATVVCRYFSVYGPRQRPDMAYHVFARALLTGEPITVYGDGRQSRGNTYVGDCVDATVRALHGGRAGEVYNVGGGAEAELIDVIHRLERLTGESANLVYQPTRTGDQVRTIADTTKIRRELGWEPRTSLDEGLARQVDWLRQDLGVAAPR